MLKNFLGHDREVDIQREASTTETSFINESMKDDKDLDNDESDDCEIILYEDFSQNLFETQTLSGQNLQQSRRKLKQARKSNKLLNIQSMKAVENLQELAQGLPKRKRGSVLGLSAQDLVNLNVRTLD